MHEWQPIATAPKDGSDILIVHSGGGMHVVFYDEAGNPPNHVWSTADGIVYHKDYPTHWMPLPTAPGDGAEHVKG